MVPREAHDGGFPVSSLRPARKRNRYKETFETYCRALGGTPEHRFHPTRRWRFDFAWPELKVAVEYEGVFGKGPDGHRAVSGYDSDLEKYGEAAIAGWCVIRVTAKTVKDGRGFALLDRALAAARQREQNAALG